MAQAPFKMSGGQFGRVFVVDPNGVARLGPANGLAAFIERHGVEEAGRLMHDAMFGPNSTVESPAGTPCGETARRWT